MITRMIRDKFVKQDDKRSSLLVDLFDLGFNHGFDFGINNLSNDISFIRRLATLHYIITRKRMKIHGVSKNILRKFYIGGFINGWQTSHDPQDF